MLRFSEEISNFVPIQILCGMQKFYNFFRKSFNDFVFDEIFNSLLWFLIEQFNSALISPLGFRIHLLFPSGHSWCHISYFSLMAFIITFRNDALATSIGSWPLVSLAWMSAPFTIRNRAGSSQLFFDA